MWGCFTQLVLRIQLCPHHKKDMLKFQPPEPKNMILFGNAIIADAILHTGVG